MALYMKFIKKLHDKIVLLSTEQLMIRDFRCVSKTSEGSSMREKVQPKDALKNSASAWIALITIFFSLHPTPLDNDGSV